MSPKYTPVTQSILCLTFLFYVRTMHRLNHGGQESIKQFVVCDSDTPVTLKQGQGHQTCYEMLFPKHYHNAKIEMPCFNSVYERANDQVSTNQETCQLSPLNMCYSEK